MLRRLTILLLLCSVLPLPVFGKSKGPATVIVQDPFVDLHTGPGRGFPSTYSVERHSSVTLLRQRTDWIKVRTEDGREGWVNRTQLERTLTPVGADVRFAGPTPEGRVEHHWEAGLATGDFGGANVVSVQTTYAANPQLHLRADVSQFLGDYSDGWLGTVGIAHVFVPQWRLSPFVGIGGGMLTISPKTSLVREQDRTDSTAYAGLGLRGFLTNRFLLQAEYRNYVVFTSRDENEEIDAWTVAFTYFF